MSTLLVIVRSIQHVRHPADIRCHCVSILYHFSDIAVIVKSVTKSHQHCHHSLDRTSYRRLEQELSCRKQIARQLRTQYVDGIHRPKYYTVTLKCRLRVTQGHCKRKHWTHHTRLTISRVI